MRATPPVAGDAAGLPRACEGQRVMMDPRATHGAPQGEAAPERPRAETTGAPEGADPSGAASPVAEPSITEPAGAVTSAGSGRRDPSEPPRTRAGNAFAGLLAGTVVLILLLVFILENTRSVRVSYFGTSGSLSLGIALLLAAVAGALLVGLTGLVRVVQLRQRLRRRPRRRGSRGHPRSA